MLKKIGRPAKSQYQIESKQEIINATTQLINNFGADYVTVRRVCEAAKVSTGTFYHYFSDKDDLMMQFLRETSFDGFELQTPSENISGLICELYMILIHKYQSLGENFMKSFYTTNNKSLSAYMGESDGKFAPNTIMARSEYEMQKALELGIIHNESNIHEICQDICTIVKGCVFEWCLSNGNTKIEIILNRIIKNYLENFLSKTKIPRSKN